MKLFLIVLLALIVLAFAVQLLRKIKLFQYAFFLRIPLFGLVFLIGFPFLAMGPASTLLGNVLVFDEKTRLGLFLTAFLALLNAAMILHVARLILRNAPTRFGIPPLVPRGLTKVGLRRWADFFQFETRLPRLLVLTIVLIPALPITITAWLNSPHPLTSALFSLLGLAAGGLVWLLVMTLSRRLGWPDRKGSQSNRKQALAEGTLAGYYEKKDGHYCRFESGHIQSLVATVLLSILYIFFGVIWRPGDVPAPAVFFLLFLTLWGGFILSGITFFLDRFRIPVLFAIAFLSFSQYTLLDVDHFYQLFVATRQEEASAEEDFLRALEARLPPGDERALVVVAASGGGIQAAGWTSRVLVGLQEEIGDELIRSVGLISAVSGGSVGAMFFTDGIDPTTGVANPARFGEIVTAATGNSLRATACGIAYPDFQRLLPLAPLFISKLSDRGRALELAFRARLAHPNATLLSWRQEMLAGKLPITVFNATLVETGDRFLISPFGFPQEMSLAFLNGFPGFDMGTATGARLSATFPYVTPEARPLFGNRVGGPNDFHAADGGFFDNFGIYTSVEWLDRVVLPNAGRLKLNRVILLSLNAFPAPPPNAVTPTAGGWVTAVAGPLLTLLSVRTSTQKSRDDFEVGLLQARWRDQVAIHFFDLRFDLNVRQGDPTECAGFLDQIKIERPYNPPLSWKLTTHEKEAIELAWQALVCRGELEPVREAFASPPSADALE